MSKRNRQVSDSHDINLPDDVTEALTEIGGLNCLLKAIPNVGKISEEVAYHKILADRTRLTILWAIYCCDMCPCILKVLMKLSDSKLSYHLSILEKANIINSYRKKNWRIYSITSKGRSALNRGAQKNPVSE